MKTDTHVAFDNANEIGDIVGSAWAVPERINGALREHQEAVADWNFTGNLQDLYRWAETIVLEFKLEIPQPCLAVDRLSRRRLGHFRRGRNNFGLLDEIAIDQEHLKDGPFFDVLGTVIHELIHSWQEHHGKPGRRNYHNNEFRDKALSFGLIVDERGVTKYDLSESSPFRNFLQKHGVELPAAEQPPAPIPVRDKSRSKLNLYECPCGVKVRIGRSRFNAQCLDCGGIFVLKEGSSAKVPVPAEPKGSNR